MSDDALLVVALAVGVLSGCGASAENGTKANAHGGESEVRAVAWHAPQVGEHRLKFSVSPPYCEFGADFQPEILETHVKPDAGRLLVTVEVLLPAGSRPKELIGCPGASLVLFGQVSSRRSFRSHVLLDGATSPPKVRWRPSKQAR
ncbi:MAG TPA: hypothetical protein VGC32_02790 [Solirubrobacterales bacterium]